MTHAKQHILRFLQMAVLCTEPVQKWFPSLGKLKTAQEGCSAFQCGNHCGSDSGSSLIVVIISCSTFRQAGTSLIKRSASLSECVYTV